MANKKLTEQEIEQLAAIRAEYDQLVVDLGNLKLRKLQLEESEGDLNLRYNLLREREVSFTKTIQETYGDGTLNLNTMEFTPSDATSNQ